MLSERKPMSLRGRLLTSPGAGVSLRAMVVRFPRLRTLLVPLACVLGLAYAIYHGVQGERGLLAWIDRSAAVERARADAAALADERHRLERRVSLLRTESLDLDLLEEQARRLLNMGHPDEQILLHGPPAR